MGPNPWIFTKQIKTANHRWINSRRWIRLSTSLDKSISKQRPPPPISSSFPSLFYREENTTYLRDGRQKIAGEMILDQPVPEVEDDVEGSQEEDEPPDAALHEGELPPGHRGGHGGQWGHAQHAREEESERPWRWAGWEGQGRGLRGFSIPSYCAIKNDVFMYFVR